MAGGHGDSAAVVQGGDSLGGGIRNVQLVFDPADELKGAGYFHSASQSKGGNLVLTLLSIRFSRNFYQIISGTKYD